MKYRSEIFRPDVNLISSLLKENIRVLRASSWMIIVALWMWSLSEYNWIYFDQALPAIIIITFVLLIKDTSESNTRYSDKKNK
jgi:hypothetical protein